jgi:low molecular weight phosphotyrosine protein phosphatase
MAEAIFYNEVSKKGLTDKIIVDSAALAAYHIGKLPDERALQCLKENGITTEHRARLVTKEDFDKFDYILGMDHENMQGLNRIKPKDKACKAQVQLLGEYDPQKELIIEDPYYGQYQGFVTVYNQCTRCCSALLEKIQQS